MLADLPAHAGGVGMFSGSLGAAGCYSALCEAAHERGIALVNTPEESERAMDLGAWYPRVEELTARSVVVCEEADLDRAARELGWPVFVKGAVKSAKEAGWEACLARDADELRRHWLGARHDALRARGVLVARELLPLRRSGEYVKGFPVAREYRVLLFGQHPLGLGFYWDGSDPWGRLDGHELAAVEEQARAAARLVGCPLLAVDLGQLEDGSWRVIEVGDPQYSDMAHVPHPAFWSNLLARLPAHRS